MPPGASPPPSPRVSTGRSRFLPRPLLSRKADLAVEGVPADVFPRGSLEALLAAEALAQLAWEGPVRWPACL